MELQLVTVLYLPVVICGMSVKHRIAHTVELK
nr:MAG TPA: protein of unknown function UPF0728 [Caudoviricetes sp.]